MIFMETVKYVSITYNFGDLADWVSALATVAAVIVSLYLANKRNKPRIIITFSKEGSVVFGKLTNKSHNPIELRLKLPNQKGFSKFNLPPINGSIYRFDNNQPFNNDDIMFSLTTNNEKILTAKGYDLVSGSKYHFLFFYAEEHWFSKEYSFIHIGKFSI